MTYILREVDFAPLRSFVSFEDRLYTKLLAPPLNLRSGFHPIIFLDVDDLAITRWGAAENAAEGTPRALIARLTHVLREARASVIFLDYDFRNHLHGDTELREELAKANATPVLLPRFFGSGALPTCEAQTDAKAPIELQTVFDDTMKTGTVASAHSIVSLGAYGLIEGTCSFYRTQVGATGERVSRVAAMLRAIELAPLPPAACDSRFDRTVPRVLSNRWWIQNDTELLHDRTTGRLAYARIKASLYVHDHTLDIHGLGLSAFDNAIAIMSSTHRWSNDFHETPVGDLPGALIAANLGLEVQSCPEPEVPLAGQFSVDVALLVISAGLTIPFCWLPLYRRIPADAQLSGVTRLYRLTLEGCIIAMFGIILMAAYIAMPHWLGNMSAGWRFGGLSFILSAMIVLIMELTSAIAEGATKLAEAAAMRLARHMRRSRDAGAGRHRAPERQGPE